jgi:hypothetical protein
MCQATRQRGLTIGIMVVMVVINLAVITFRNLRLYPDCVAIHEAIKAMPDGLDLSNPTTFRRLPFPSLHPMPFQRFDTKKINGIHQFDYMGRSKFRELQNRAKGKHFLDVSESIYVSGTSGSGKSHLLAAFVCHLIREGKRVFYLPDCSTSLLLDPARAIWTALRFAFYDSAALGTIGHDDVNALINLMSNHRDLDIIVDQVNALEITENDSCKATKVLALRWLRAMRFKHRYIFSATANENSNREVDRKQSGITVFRMLGGMNKVC